MVNKIDDLVKASMLVERRLMDADDAINEMVACLGRLTPNEDLDEAIQIIQMLNVTAELAATLARKLKGRIE